MKKENEKKENIFLTLFYAILIALVIRTFFFQPFFIPSSSMEPNLLVGDRLFVSKYSYGYSRHSFPFSLNIIKDRIFFSEVKRGDISVFKVPTDTELNKKSFGVDYIKRIIAIPGDKIEMKNGVLTINGVKLEQKKLRTDKKILKNGKIIELDVFLETNLEGRSYEIYNYYNDGPADDFEEYTVPEKHFFALGDNRDNSKDSRFVGPIPIENLVGKAQIIFFSTKDGSKMYEIWKWPFGVQYKRLFNSIN
ncbi:MAG: signal peptidase I [Candidatus Pelagibacterales bacterium]|tara:strand:- start:697 stop:1446 length:750 start_codon:yes stop_codon:yes gene_type:complete